MPTLLKRMGAAVAPLNDPTRLQAYKDALRNWKFTGYIQFELNETAWRWIRRELDGVTPHDIKRLMYEHVANGGEIDEVRETRPEYSDEYEFHHDLRLLLQNKPVYIETRLKYWIPFVPDESWILVVNVHAPC